MQDILPHLHQFETPVQWEMTSAWGQKESEEVHAPFNVSISLYGS
jgi:hypothetical protein